MSYCINPNCQARQNPDNLKYCQACGSDLIINGRYQLLRPLRELREQHHTELFEIDEIDSKDAWAKPKVLKVLRNNQRRFVELFEQEAKVLQRLRHPGIPNVDNYLIVSTSNGSQELHCLVMEKIPGLNLAQRLEEFGPILETLAIDWLRQLVNILAQVHQNKFLHRDIKPSNIMLRPEGQLVLIDFGTVRELTQTYDQKLERRELTQILSIGYTAPEQFNGRAVPQSDYFALGRTFVHLLTGIHPSDISIDSQTDRLIWRDEAPQISSMLADLIDDLMAPLLQDRPQNPQIILQRLRAVGASRTSEEVSLAPKQPGTTKTTSWRQHGILLIRHSFSPLIASMIFASALLGVRYVGSLQPLELQVFDRMLTLRPTEKPDPRLLVVTITEADIRAQNPQQRRGSLSDSAFLQLLQKLEQLKPRVIGLDIYRDFPVDPAYPELATLLRQNQHLIAVCKGSDSGSDPSGVSPPPEVAPERLGFSDFVTDPDGIVRRHLLAMAPEPASACATSYAFSTMLAIYYLIAQGIPAKFTSDGDLQLGSTILNRLKPHTGAYQQVDTRGKQVLLNYRSSPSPQEIAAQVTLTQVLNGRLNPEYVRDRIVLIGATGTSAGDLWSTPYGADSEQQIPGVLMQAQMVSQLLSAVLDRRSLLWFWPQWGEVLWIWGWAFIGGMLAMRFRSLLHLGLAIVAGELCLYILCFSFLAKSSCWVPLVPSALSLAITSVSLVTYVTYRNRLA